MEASPFSSLFPVSEICQCIPIALGVVAVVSPTQTDPAIMFIMANAADASLN
jgi:hypothetical protein